MQERSSFYTTYQQHPGSFVPITVGLEYRFIGIPKTYKIIRILPNVNDTYNAEVQETSGVNTTVFTEPNIIKVNDTYFMYIHKKIFQKILPKNEDPTNLEGGKRKQKRKTKYRRRRSIKHKKTRKV